jgi:hypothetical protein
VTLAEWSALFVAIAGVVVGLCAYVSNNSRKFLTCACVVLVVLALALAAVGTLTHNRVTAAASRSSNREPNRSRSPESSAGPSESPTASPSYAVVNAPPTRPTGPPVGTPLTSDGEDGNPIISDGGDVYYNVSGISINGKTFVHSYEAKCQMLCNSQETTQLSLDLRRKYRMLIARFGISDDSLSSTKAAAIEVIADGTIIYHGSFSLGHSADVNLKVSGVLRLIVQFSGPLGSVYPSVGEPTAYS